MSATEPATLSLTEVAKAIGQPRATRAVAQACANNPAALVIPCHRVIGRDGALKGYAWGLQRKYRRLIHEKADVRRNGTAVLLGL